ncbi:MULTISPECIES: hypothetical protein [Halorussus]|uniref:hypothetical protein n=1 Tax=Halorussus TaxID=1070314 RepID=UPI000E20E68E|nr:MULTISPECIES: hypothetical protein [Halorussus]NHN57878.1 hypothetical protein [Halorussus sp. JP-T4]
MPDPPVRERRVAPETVPDGLTLAAFNTDCSEATLDALGDTLGRYLDIDDVTVGTTLTDEQPEEFAVLHNSVLVGGPLVHPGRGDDPIGEVVSPFRQSDTLFLAGYGDRAGLRALSNRIETLAWRAGEGRLYAAGQQRFASMDDQWGIYADVAEAGCEVHVFEEPAYVPGDDRFVVHGERHSLAGTWLVAFDGAGNDAAKAAMLAEERDPDSYYGVWTVVPELVDAIIDRVDERTAGEQRTE